MRKKSGAFIAPFVVSSVLFSATAFSDVFELESKVPGTLQGELGYASMQYWVTTADGEIVQIWADAEAEDQLIDMIGEQVNLKGATDTYSDGSVYFLPEFSEQSAKPTLQFTIDENQYDDPMSINLDGQLVNNITGYYTANIDQEFATEQGKVALIQLSSGGTACPAVYMLAIAQYDAQPLVTPVFGNCSDIPDISTKGENIHISFPGNPAQNWVWENSTYRLYKE